MFRTMTSSGIVLKQEDARREGTQTDNMHIQYESRGHLSTETVHTNTHGRGVHSHKRTHTRTHSLTPAHRSTLWRSGVILFPGFRASRRRAACWTPGNPPGWCLWESGDELRMYNRLRPNSFWTLLRLLFMQRTDVLSSDGIYRRWN